MRIAEILYSTVANKCPRCHQAKVFEKNNPYTFSHPLKMREACTECHLRYEKEPGFFYGALYVSYALMAGIFILWFLVDLFWLHTEPIELLGLVVGTMLLLYPVVFRSARLIWLNFFNRYDKKYDSHKHGIHQY
jgi:uncharacterized protein (DUF983 family)